MPDLTLTDDATTPWWEDLVSVDGVPDALERDPAMQPSPEGEAFLAKLATALEERAKQPDVDTFIARTLVTTTMKTKPACVRVKWRGVVVCSHSVPKLDAWAKATGATLLWPLAGCGSYQTSTVASAGTHAGGGAIDLNGNGMSTATRAMVAQAGRANGLQVDWFRALIKGVWTNHFHAIDPDCPQLSRVAAAQCVEMFAGGDGLVGTRPDPGYRGNVPQLKGIFNGRMTYAVTTVSDAVTSIGKTVVAAAKIKALQRFIGQPQSGVWDVETDIDLRNTRSVALEGYTGAYFKKWSPAQRKRMQLSWGAAQDGIWGPATKAKAQAAARFIQTQLGVGADGVWGPAGPTEKAYQAMRATAYRPFRLTLPVGAFQTPGKAGSLYGPSTAGKAWYSGASAGVLTVGQIQYNVRRIQCATGTAVTGRYSSTTANAVRAWQAKHKLVVDGLVGPQTWAAMAALNKG